MHLEVTFRHMNARPEIKTRASALYGKLERFLDPAADGQLVVDAENGQTTVELVITSRGHTAKAVESDDDLRTAMDRAFHRVEDQLRRTKEKGISRRRRGSGGGDDDADADYLDDEETVFDA